MVYPGKQLSILPATSYLRNREGMNDMAVLGCVCSECGRVGGSRISSCSHKNSHQWLSYPIVIFPLCCFDNSPAILSQKLIMQLKKNEWIIFLEIVHSTPQDICINSLYTGHFPKLSSPYLIWKLKFCILHPRKKLKYLYILIFHLLNNLPGYYCKKVLKKIYFSLYKQTFHISSFLYHYRLFGSFMKFKS